MTEPSERNNFKMEEALKPPKVEEMKWKTNKHSGERLERIGWHDVGAVGKPHTHLYYPFSQFLQRKCLG